MTAPDGILAASSDRRRLERRTSARVADLSLPELRRILITSILFVIVVTLFLWMVRTVVIAGILGVVIAAYLFPVYHWISERTGRPKLAAILTLLLLILPLIGALIHTVAEVNDVARYLVSNQSEIVQRIDGSVQKYTVFEGEGATRFIRRSVVRAASYGARIPDIVGDAIAGFSIAASIFIFTTFYVFTDAKRIVSYVRGHVPERYNELSAALEKNIRGVLYGAVYSTLVTQTLKSVILFVLCLAFQVPLAGALAILSFIIGFFPIVGSWSVIIPVGIWLLVYRQNPVAAVLIIVIGLAVNTVFISMYLRPKLAADKSRVLNFYWMFVGLVTGVYTFGLPGVLLGPILIGMLKAVVDTVVSRSNWRLVELDVEPATISE